MMLDNDDNHRTNKTNRSSIFTSNIFTRVRQNIFFFEYITISKKN
jgi:hypothetical protein